MKRRNKILCKNCKTKIGDIFDNLKYDKIYKAGIIYKDSVNIEPCIFYRPKKLLFDHNESNELMQTLKNADYAIQCFQQKVKEIQGVKIDEVNVKLENIKNLLGRVGLDKYVDLINNDKSLESVGVGEDQKIKDGVNDDNDISNNINDVY